MWSGLARTLYSRHNCSTPSVATRIALLKMQIAIVTILLVLPFASPHDDDDGPTGDITIDLLAHSLYGIADTLKANSWRFRNDTECSCQAMAPTPLPTSCKEIKKKWPKSISGYYKIGNKAAGTPVYVYCDMEELCSSGGGWTRLAYLDMSDATQNCPSGFRLYQSGGVRACGRPVTISGSCVSVQFPSNGISYSQVCGRVVGYQWGSTDAVQHGEWRHGYQPYYLGGTDPKHNNINAAYVDGVSITRGYPRTHVWTYMAGLQGSGLALDGRYNCPCSTGSLQGPHVQSFIGKDYYCESGTSADWSQVLYTSDPLWDGKGCGAVETDCCAVSGQPWFHKNYKQTTTDHIELRVCADQTTRDEDVPVSSYEIYVK